MDKKFLLVNKGKGVINNDNPIMESNLFEFPVPKITEQVNNTIIPETEEWEYTGGSKIKHLQYSPLESLVRVYAKHLRLYSNQFTLTDNQLEILTTLESGDMVAADYYRLGGLVVDDITTLHKERVEADGGVIPDLYLLRNEIAVLLETYELDNYEDLISKLPATLDPNVYGYKKGVGSAITKGQACEKLYSINPIADVEQITIEKQPLLLEHTGENYVYFPRKGGGDSVRSANTQNISFNTVTDTVICTAKIFMNNQAAPLADYIVDNGMIFMIRNNGASKILDFDSDAGAAQSSSYTPSETEPHWVRWTVTPTEIIYEWSVDGQTWININIGTVARPALDAMDPYVKICHTSGSSANAISVYHAVLENITNGSKITFDPNNFIREASETSWAGIDSNWTVDHTAVTTGLKVAVVDSTIIIGDGISYKLTSSTFNLTQPYTIYVSIKRQGVGTIVGLGDVSQVSNDGTNTILNNGIPLTLSDSSKSTKLITIISNGSSSSIKLNNGTPITGDAGINEITRLEILGNTNTYGNYIFKSIIISNGN